MKNLEGKRIAILLEDGFEQIELTSPKQALEEAGAQVDIISPKKDFVKLKDIKLLFKENNIQFFKESLQDEILEAFPGSEYIADTSFFGKKILNIFKNLKSK